MTKGTPPRKHSALARHALLGLVAWAATAAQATLSAAGGPVSAAEPLKLPSQALRRVGAQEGWQGPLFMVCMAIFAVGFAAMFYSVWKHHRSGAVNHGNFHQRVIVEMSWTLVPFVIVMVLVWPMARGFWIA